MKSSAVLLGILVTILGVAGFAGPRHESGWYVWTGGHETRIVERANAVHVLAEVGQYVAIGLKAYGYLSANPGLIEGAEQAEKICDAIEKATPETERVTQSRAVIMHVRAGIERSGVDADQHSIDFHRIMGEKRYPGERNRNNVGPSFYGIRPRHVRGTYVQHGPWLDGEW